jgi:uncharacterized membrane protein
MKKFIAGFLTCAILIFTLLTFGFAEEVLNIVLNPYPVYVNGTQVEVEGYNINGFTFLKLADVGKCFDSTTSFNQTEERIDINGNSIPTTETISTPAPSETPFETSDFIVLKLDVSQITIQDSEGEEYTLIMGFKSDDFISGETAKGYWQDEVLRLQDKNGIYHSGYDAVP